MNRIQPISRPDYEDMFDIGAGPIAVDAAIMETGLVPTADYVSQERFDQEKAVFRKVWLNIARIEELPDPGDWIVRDIDCLDTSILLTRDRKGQLRAFHNVCLHRSMRLVWQTSGTGTSFTCPYHAWTFAADGTLTGVPDEASFPCLDKAASSLKPIALDIWEGFIFIHMDPEPCQSLRDYLHPLASRITDVSFDAYAFSVTLREELHANWKLAMEAQSENYHIRALHSRTVSAMVASADNPFAHVLNWEALGAHGTYSSPANPAFQLSKQKHVQSFAFLSASFLTSPGEGEKQVAGFGPRQGFNPAESDRWGADQITVFPHFLLNVSPNGWWMHRFWPVAPDRTLWEAAYYFSKPSSARQAFALQYFLAFNRDTLMEDSMAIRMQQSAMKSGAVPFIQFGEQELACRHIAAVTTAAVRSQDKKPA